MGKDGVLTNARLIRGTDNRLYGTTQRGGFYDRGTVFAINPDGTGYIVLRHFESKTAQGCIPYGSLIQGIDGRLYGTTSAGLNDQGTGTIFAIKTDGTGYEVLRELNGLDGREPRTSLFQGPNGRLFGVTESGGQFNRGTIFAVNPDKSDFAVLRHINLDDGTNSGWRVGGGLILGPDQRLYGVAATNGPFGSGTIYAINQDGSGFSLVHAFSSAAPVQPRGPLQLGSDGRFYGVTFASGTEGNGTIYSINPDGSNFQTLHSFLYLAQGARPDGGVIEGLDGRLYGTTSIGGAGTTGTVFAINRDGSGYQVLQHLVPSANNGGYGPQSALLQLPDGRLYALTNAGGQGGNGTVFTLQPNGSGFTALRHLQYQADASAPQAALLDGGDGRLYGTTVSGGRFSRGTIFAINRDGTGFTLLRQFGENDGQNPYASLIRGIDGRLYGTARSFSGSGNYSGTIFSLNRDGSDFTVLRFLNATSDGASPMAGLLQARNGRLYGTTSGGGAVGVGGTIFTLRPDGSEFSVLRHLNRTTDGGVPYSVLIQGSDGRLYGTTSVGGANDAGTVFALNVEDPQLPFQVLRHLVPSTDGNGSRAGLIRAKDSWLYGTTSAGGPLGAGTIFRIDEAGSAFSVVRAMSSVAALGGGNIWTAVMQALDGLLYGAATFGGQNGWGTLFRLHPNGTGFEAFHHFQINDPSGNYPYAPLIQAFDGKLYSTTTGGGSFGLGGTIYSVTIAAPPVITSPLTASGTYAQPFNYTITASNNPTDFDALGLPNGLSVNHGTGLISGHPAQTGQFSVDIAASNAGGPGTATLALTITPATASIMLGGLAAIFDGTPKPVSATTAPAGLATRVTYNGSETAPTNAGSFSVVATIGDANYTGSASGTLVIGKAIAGLTITGTNAIFDGNPKPVSVMTAPPGLATTVTYDGSGVPPTNPGSYAVIVTISDANYQGSASATLTVSAAAPIPLDVTAQVQVTTSGFRLNRATQRFAQTITLVNTSAQTIAGPLSLVFDQLSPNATLASSAGTTSALAPLGSPFLVVNLGADAILTPAEALTLNVEFANAANQPITYTPRLLAGPGTR